MAPWSTIFTAEEALKFIEGLPEDVTGRLDWKKTVYFLRTAIDSGLPFDMQVAANAFATAMRSERVLTPRQADQSKFLGDGRLRDDTIDARFGPENAAREPDFGDATGEAGADTGAAAHARRQEVFGPVGS